MCYMFEKTKKADICPVCGKIVDAPLFSIRCSCNKRKR